MKKIYFLMIACICISLQGVVSVIWQADRSRIWESQWLDEIMHGLEFSHIHDGNFDIVKDGSIIIMSPNNSDKTKKYFNTLKSLNYKFGVILLSDECYTSMEDFYKDAQFVFRNYWHKKFASYNHVISFGLGYKAGLSTVNVDKIPTSTERKYIWSFAGQVQGKPTRQAMMNQIKKIQPYFIHEIFTWNDARSLGVSEYKKMLLDSVFLPSPTGWWNLDSFRVWEALECGCIPIVENKPLDYFGKFLGEHPFIVVNSWSEAPRIMQQYLANPDLLEQRRLECWSWWLNYKKTLNAKFVEVITKAFKN